jgi:O-antigen/teichoic acid export membrane protein
MSLGKQTARAGLWLAAFRFVTQAVSWTITIAIARMLTPGDYGLMAMASIFTGYVEVFSEMGMGAAIVQRQLLSSDELSSNFWFSLLIGCGFAGGAFVLAYPTAWLFDNAQVIPLTQAISVLFIVGALMVVPFNLLTRELRFQAIGLVQLVAVVASSLSMLWMARHQFGVWTLIGGVIVLRVLTVVLVFYASGWKPRWHFRLDDVKPFLRFGLGVAGSRSLFYCFQKLDKVIVGKMLGVQALGFYSFALEMASIPTDKMISIVNQVSFPLFSRVQHDRSQLMEVYTKVTRYVALLASPLFLAGAVFGEEIIYAILGEQWGPSIFLFRTFCVVQILMAIGSLHGVVHNALGRPYRMLGFYAVTIVVMAPALVWASMYGMNALAIPWLTVYPLLWFGWTAVTIGALQLPWRQYLEGGLSPVGFSMLVIAAVAVVQAILRQMGISSTNWTVLFLQELLLGGIMYTAYLFTQEKDTVAELKSLRSGN